MKCLIVCCLAALLRAQDPTPTQEPAVESPLAEFLRYVDWGRAVDGIGQAFGRPERLLEGLSIRPVVLSERNDSADGPLLGVEYDFQKNIATPIVLSSRRATGLALDFVGRGTVAFESDQNPHDLLETGLKLSLFGIFSSTSAKAGELERRARADDAPQAEKEAYQALLLRSDALLAEISARATSTSEGSQYKAALESPDFLKFLEENPEGYLGVLTSWTWHADLKAAYETNQEFTERQGAFGVRLGTTGFSDDPHVTSWNLLDYPLSITRWLTGQEDASRMRGHFPRVTVGLDIVDPQQDGEREATGEDLDAYPRFSAELGFASDFGTISGRALKASADWRFFQELDPSDEIEDADLDRSEYFSVALTDVDSGIFFSYATGRLPLDSSSDSVFAVGWNFSR